MSSWLNILAATQDEDPNAVIQLVIPKMMCPDPMKRPIQHRPPKAISMLKNNDELDDLLSLGSVSLTSQDVYKYLSPSFAF